MYGSFVDVLHLVESGEIICTEIFTAASHWEQQK